LTINRKALTCAGDPLVAQNHRNFGDAQLARGLQAQVTIDDLTVATGEYRDLEAELADAAAHAIHGRVVLARVAGVENKFVNWPVLDSLGQGLREHTSPSEYFNAWLGESSIGRCCI
jgi:hypothetical protein